MSGPTVRTKGAQVTVKPLSHFRRIGPSEAADLILRHRRRVLPELALYDTRDRRLFEQSHVHGAEHLDDKILGLKRERIPKRSPVVVYGDPGHTSQCYALMLADLGFREVYCVDGGFEPLAAALALCERPPALATQGFQLSDALSVFLREHQFDCSFLDAPRAYGMTPLMRAALLGRLDLVDELLRLGVDVGLRNVDGNNALWLACVSNDENVVRRLIQSGVDVDNRNDTGATALMYVASSGKADLVALLLRAGADPDILNQDDFKAVDLASSRACLELLRYAGHAQSGDPRSRDLDAG